MEICSLNDSSRFQQRGASTSMVLIWELYTAIRKIDGKNKLLLSEINHAQHSRYTHKKRKPKIE
jgi:hypothetical protein